MNVNINYSLRTRNCFYSELVSLLIIIIIIQEREEESKSRRLWLALVICLAFLYGDHFHVRKINSVASTLARLFMSSPYTTHTSALGSFVPTKCKANAGLASFPSLNILPCFESEGQRRAVSLIPHNQWEINVGSCQFIAIFTGSRMYSPHLVVAGPWTLLDKQPRLGYSSIFPLAFLFIPGTLFFPWINWWRKYGFYVSDV